MEINILWSSQTGKAIDLSKQLTQLLQQSKIPLSSASPLTELTTFTQGIWVIFISTTGQGQPPYSMRTFWKNIMKKGYKIQEGVSFAIYSLGDRSYGQNFGMAGRKLRQRLKMLGAKQLIEIGLGDQQQTLGVRQVFERGWAKQLLSTINNLPINQNPKNLSLHFNLRQEQEQKTFQVISHKEIGQRKGRKVIWVQISKKDGKPIQEGDTLELYPHNRKEDVQFMLSHFQQTGQEKYNYLNKELTLRQILTEQVNISSPLNHYFFNNSSLNDLLSCCNNQLHKNKITQFSKDFDQFHNYIGKYKRNIVQFIKDFQITININYFLSHINQLVGRKYSIAKIQPGGSQFFIIVKIVQIQITAGRIYKGLCSHDLLGEKVVRKGKIIRGDITPSEIRKHNLIVTLGTGIAPFLWMLDKTLKEKQEKFLLIYCNSYKDELFHQILTPQLQQNSQSYSQLLSCTREGGPKLVDLIHQNPQTIKNFLNQQQLKSSRIFFCGPKQLQSFLSLTISQILNIPQQQLTKNKLIVYQNW